MLNHIMKDFRFTARQLLIVAAFMLAFPMAILIDGDNKTEFISLLLPFFSTSILLGKICFLEDKQDIRVLLKLLPISSYKRIASRYLFTTLILVLSVAYSVALQIIVFDLELSKITPPTIMILGAFLLYFSVYIAVFYYKDYFMAQNAIWFFMAIVIGGSVFIQRGFLTIDMTKIGTNLVYAYGVLGIGVLSFIVSYFLTVKHEISHSIS